MPTTKGGHTSTNALSSESRAGGKAKRNRAGAGMQLPALKKGRIKPMELVAVVVVVGLVGVVAASAFDRYQRKAKTVEAVLMLDIMWEGAYSYYEQTSSCRGPCPCHGFSPLPPDVGWTPSLGTCGSSGCRYRVNVSLEDFHKEAAWIALDFAITEFYFYGPSLPEPFYFSYRFESCEVGIPDFSWWSKSCADPVVREHKALMASGRKGGGHCKANSTISCQASGDLDDDGKYSLFRRDGRIVVSRRDGYDYYELRPDPRGITARDPLE